MKGEGRGEEPQDEDSTEFFRGKRRWSKIKDEVLGSYMPVYLSKVARLGPQIILIDAFAGPGKFDDNSAGSPLIICQASEKHAKGKYLAVFVNRERKHHDKLAYVLQSFIETKSAVTILGTASELLAEVRGILTDQTVFIYLDPFGLKGCEFATIEPFLSRSKAFSTEIIVNLSIPTMHRLAARNVVADGGPVSSSVRSFHQRLSRVLGGDYWQSILWDDDKDPETKAREVMARYREKLMGYGFPYSGSCPVREKPGSRIKYYITFCSRHPHAMLLMNDAMCTAYHRRMHEADTEGTLFAQTDWREGRSANRLKGIVVDAVERLPGRHRNQVWEEIVQHHFMEYVASEYKNAVKDLVKSQAIRYEDFKGTGRLNDDSRLYPPK